MDVQLGSVVARRFRVVRHGPQTRQGDIFEAFDGTTGAHLWLRVMRASYPRVTPEALGAAAAFGGPLERLVAVGTTLEGFSYVAERAFAEERPPRRSGTVFERERCALGVLDALERLWKCGFVHGNVTPSHLVEKATGAALRFVTPWPLVSRADDAAGFLEFLDGFAPATLRMEALRRCVGGIAAGADVESSAEAFRRALRAIPGGSDADAPFERPTTRCPALPGRASTSKGEP